MLILAAGRCSPCPRSGCDAFGRRASYTVRQGVAGSVASQSDAINDGCEACPLDRTQLRLWKTAGRVADLAAAREVAAGAPTRVIDVDGRYQVELDSGDYLLCALRYGPVEQPCAAFVVGSGTVTTINVKRRYGPTGLLIFDPGAPGPRSPEVFDFSPAN
jgi:hypothetical protein